MIRYYQPTIRSLSYLNARAAFMAVVFFLGGRYLAALYTWQLSRQFFTQWPCARASRVHPALQASPTPGARCALLAQAHG